MIIHGISDMQVNFAPETEFDEIVQNIRTLLSTYIFSVPLDRRLGISADIIDLPLDGVNTASLESTILDAVRMYEPRVEVRQISFRTNIDTQTIVPVVDVVIKGSETSGFE